MPDAMKKVQYFASDGPGFVTSHHILFPIQVLTQVNLQVSGQMLHLAMLFATLLVLIWVAHPVLFPGWNQAYSPVLFLVPFQVWSQAIRPCTLTSVPSLYPIWLLCSSFEQQREGGLEWVPFPTLAGFKTEIDGKGRGVIKLTELILWIFCCDVVGILLSSLHFHRLLELFLVILHGVCVGRLQIKPPFNTHITLSCSLDF